MRSHLDLSLKIDRLLLQIHPNQTGVVVAVDLPSQDFSNLPRSPYLMSAGSAFSMTMASLSDTAAQNSLEGAQCISARVLRCHCLNALPIANFNRVPVDNTGLVPSYNIFGPTHNVYSRNGILYFPSGVGVHHQCLLLRIDRQPKLSGPCMSFLHEVPMEPNINAEY